MPKDSLTKEEIEILYAQCDMFKEKLDTYYEIMTEYIDTLEKDEQIELIKKMIEGLMKNKPAV